MSAQAWSYVFGLLGAVTPGTLKLGWRIRRGKRVDSGTIDFTQYKTRP